MARRLLPVVIVEQATCHAAHLLFVQTVEPLDEGAATSRHLPSLAEVARSGGHRLAAAARRRVDRRVLTDLADPARAGDTLGRAALNGRRYSTARHVLAVEGIEHVA